MTIKVSKSEWKKKVIADAKQPGYLGSFGIPFDQYTAKISGDPAHDVVFQVIFTHKRTRAELVLSSVWTDDNGAILQAGTNHGRLTL